LADARKRINAIKQYSTLGSGFKIAMRDLEIRGAGNLLGSQQSGHITAVGFDLYCQLLKQSIHALKGEKVRRRIEVQVRLDFLALNPGDERQNSKFKIENSKLAEAEVQNPKSKIQNPKPVASEVDVSLEGETPKSKIQNPKSDRAFAFIPLGYVSDSRQRIEIYRKLAGLTDAASIEQLRAEMRDRFGPLPPPLELLLQIAALKILASDRGITTIETKSEKLMLTRHNDYVTLDGKFPRLTQSGAKARLNEITRLIQTLR
jgi:transcription-repair coupling factor (superfamily II helicase)